MDAKDFKNFSNNEWPECGKPFRTPTALNYHMRLCDNDQKYVCHWPGCQYRCCDRGNFRKNS
jgi:hypothetical protein